MRKGIALVALVALGAGALLVTSGPGGRDIGRPPGPAAAGPGPECEYLETGIRLPGEVPETSGLARSGRDPGLLWTHNDAGNAPELFAVDESGALIQRVRVVDAELVDWEDIESAPCGNATCLYVGDIGDNEEDRDRITVYRVTEPAPWATRTAPAAAFHARFPGGPRDAESLFIDGGGVPYVITKGRRGTVDLYRWPAPPRPGETVILERVRQLFAEPADRRDRITAATSTPDRRWVGARSYRTIYLYPAAALLAGDDVRPLTIDLSGRTAPRGESLAMADDGVMWISSEGGDGEGATLSRIRCALPDA